MCPALAGMFFTTNATWEPYGVTEDMLKFFRQWFMMSSVKNVTYQGILLETQVLGFLLGAGQ